jgi:4-amino-4-deoxy-L-arabinose transferase-like glycosyltransferase
VTSAARGRVERSVWGGPWVALAALLAGAAVLRLVGVRYGLPFAFLNPDEESIVPRAWRMAHGGGLDPGFFDYPSLLFYVLAPFQAWADEPSYLAARLVVVALGVAGVAAAWWLGRRAYGPVAGPVAAAGVAVATTHVAYSRMAVTDVPLTLGVTVALALLVSSRLEWAGLVAGLAAGTKYPGLFLVVPLVVLGWGRWRRLALSAGFLVAGFLASSPFVAVHPREALGDARRVQRLAGEGWLGFEDEGWAGFAFVDRLWDALGPALLVAALGLAVALVRRRPPDLALASFVLVSYAGLLASDAHFDRYTLPLVPALAALAGRLRSLAPVTLLLLVVPFTWSVREAHRLTRTDTRAVAHGWIERHVPASASVAADPSAPPLEGFRRVVRFALPGPGRPFDPQRSVDRLRRDGVEYVVVTGAVTDRVLAARERYPRESAFYDALRARTRRAYYLAPDGQLTGPWVAVYHLSS